jgi:hypothetical protein
VYGHARGKRLVKPGTSRSSRRTSLSATQYWKGVQLRLDTSRQDLFQLDTPFDDLVAPMIGRLVEAGEFELEKMLDDVLAERARLTEIAASQILDLLGYVFEVELVSGGR